MKKKFTSILLLIAMLIFTFDSTLVHVYANKKTEKKICEKSEKFNKSKKKEYTKKKIDNEKRNKTHIIDEKMEEYLNDSGIFDDEICRMDQKTIDEISQNKINDIQVATSFYEYNETTKKTISNESESDNDVIEESDLVEIGPSEINKVIAEVYFDKVVEEEESVLDKTLEAIGIKPVNVYAGVNYDYYYDENKSYMKRSILVVPTIINGIQYYKILCYYEWLTMPLNRLTDVACITFDANSKFNNNRAAFDNTYAKVTTEYTVTERRELTGERLSVRHDTSVDILKNIYYNENADERELEVGELAISSVC